MSFDSNVSLKNSLFLDFLCINSPALFFFSNKTGIHFPCREVFDHSITMFCIN